MPVEAGKSNPLMEAVQQIGVSTDGAVEQPVAAEVKTGSFEAFMGAFAARPGGLEVGKRRGEVTG